jgi:hypothetical protein
MMMLMRWKGVFALLLAVSFLSASSWAEVCELACASSSRRHVCPICGSGSHTAAMHCAHMDGQESATGAHIELTASASSQCALAFCTQPVSANLPAKAFESDQLKWTVNHPASHFEGGIIAVRYVDRHPPPILIDDYRPLTVALRI